MATTNTIIQILRSYSTSVPSTLNDGELAYSFVSDKLFIGDGSGGVFDIGGKYYTDIINSATTANTPNSLVLRDDTGAANFTSIYVDTLDTKSLTISGDLQVDGNTRIHDVYITGNLYVEGTTTEVNTTVTQLDNNVLYFNTGISPSEIPILSAYIEVDRGAQGNSSIKWNETGTTETSSWQISRDSTNFYDILTTEGGQSVQNNTTFYDITASNNASISVLSVNNEASIGSSLTVGTFLNVGEDLTANNIHSTFNISSNTASISELLTTFDLTSTNNAILQDVTIYGNLTLDNPLAVTSGGTGLSFVANNGIVFGNDFNTLQVTAQGQPGNILQVDDNNIPFFGMLNGGTF